jgi:hypothetical protein
MLSSSALNSVFIFGPPVGFRMKFLRAARQGAPKRVLGNRDLRALGA